LGIQPGEDIGDFARDEDTGYSPWGNIVDPPEGGGGLQRCWGSHLSGGRGKPKRLGISPESMKPSGKLLCQDGKTTVLNYCSFLCPFITF
jgi:hypothetical protein